MRKRFWERYKTYDTNNGYGNAQEWRDAFGERMNRDEAARVLEADQEAPHVILGVSPEATSEQIKKAFRALMLHWHPDRNPDRIEEATEKTRRILAAYSLLTDIE